MKARALVLAATLVPAGLAAAAPAPPACTPAELFRDDFSRFPPGWLWTPIGQLNGAIQEYHYLPHRGTPLGPWANPITHLDAWVVSDEDGVPYLEQHLVYELVAQSNPLFITGDPEWGDVTVEARVRPLSPNEKVGLVLRYKTNRNFLAFVLTGGKTARLFERLPIESAFRVAGEREVATAAFPYDSRKYYRLRVEDRNGRVRASIDDKVVLEADVAGAGRGKTGVVANVPARFQDFRVSACAEARTAAEQRIRTRDGELAKLRAENPQPKLWKKFDTPKFGAGRNVRFGDLDGDGSPEMLIGQNIMRVRGDAFDHISALTAVTLDGKVLWQLGRPDPRNTLLTNDTPFQIHDIDGDGKNDVVLIRDFKLQILDGATGKVKHWAWQHPTSTEDKPPYELNSGDCISFIDATGSGARREIVLKDRYKRFWVYNNKLEKLWEGQTNSGHYPYPFDADGDKKEELLIGYSLFSGDGRRLWDRDDVLDDHADAGVMGNFSADPKAAPRVYWVGSDEGFIVTDAAGTILKHQRIGHAQNLTVAKFRPDAPGLQIMTVNFWKSPGIVSLFDTDGNMLAQDEPIHSGSELLPVNWRGDGQEFALLSGNIREGGMLDGQLRRAVMFPDDGHPDLAAQVMDLTGDARDEVILWDTERVWIYTQDRPFTGTKVYAPQRNPKYNDSNYRAHISLPAWK